MGAGAAGDRGGDHDRRPLVGGYHLCAVDTEAPPGYERRSEALRELGGGRCLEDRRGKMRQGPPLWLVVVVVVGLVLLASYIAFPYLMGP